MRAPLRPFTAGGRLGLSEADYDHGRVVGAGAQGDQGVRQVLGALPAMFGEPVGEAPQAIRGRTSLQWPP